MGRLLWVGVGWAWVGCGSDLLRGSVAVGRYWVDWSMIFVVVWVGCWRHTGPPWFEFVAWVVCCGTAAGRLLVLAAPVVSWHPGKLMGYARNPASGKDAGGGAVAADAFTNPLRHCVIERFCR